jgi:hypothetical protein
MNAKYVFITAIAVFVSFFCHEWAHWAMGELLGNQMAMSLNSSYPVSGNYLKWWHDNVISAAGPLFTIIQAFVFYLVIKKTNNLPWYPFLLMPFIMRLLAMGISFFNANDEARISESAGLGLFTIPLLVCMLLFLPLYSISKKNRYSFKLNALTVLWMILFITALILSDHYFKIKIF